MILQYKGFNNNWSYEQANNITWAKINVREVVKEYEVGELSTYLKKLDTFIQKQTKCSDNFYYLLVEKQFDELDKVYVVTLKDKSKNITYVFDSGVYLLNDNGGTVQKIA